MFNKIIEYKEKVWFGPLCIFLAVCFAMAHLPLMGIPLGVDLPTHLQFASTYQHAILTGDFFPGWAPSDNYGFGSVGIRFYPPLAYYLMAMTQMLTHNWYDTFWTNAFFWMFVGAIGMYLWSREWLTVSQSTLVAVFYTFAPYHRYQIYHFILFAEFAAAGILPFCFWLLTRVIKRGRWIDAVLFGISLALLILTHIPTTLLGVLGLAIYGLLLMDWKEFPRTAARLLVGAGLGLLASSYHWLRLVTELDWVKHTAETYTANFYDFRQHLFPIKYEPDLFTPPIDYAVVLLMLSLVPLGIFLLTRFKSTWKNGQEKKLALSLMGTGAVCLFMTTDPSLFIWENVGFIQKIQFPWRWMSVGYLVASFAFVFGITQLYQTFRRSNRLAVAAATVFYSAVFMVFVVLTTHQMLPLNREDFATEIKGLEAKRGCSCWFPTWAQPLAFKNRERITTDGRAFTINKWEGEAREFTIEPGSPQNVRIATFYYPHWRATVDGQQVDVEKGADGTLSVQLPAERSAVRLFFREPQLLIAAQYISAFVWIVLLMFVISKKLRSRNFKEND